MAGTSSGADARVTARGPRRLEQERQVVTLGRHPLARRVGGGEAAERKNLEHLVRPTPRRRPRLPLPPVVHTLGLPSVAAVVGANRGAVQPQPRQHHLQQHLAHLELEQCPVIDETKQTGEEARSAARARLSTWKVAAR